MKNNKSQYNSTIHTPHKPHTTQNSQNLDSTKNTLDSVNPPPSHIAKNHKNQFWQLSCHFTMKEKLF